MDWTWIVTAAAMAGAVLNAQGRLGAASLIWLLTNSVWMVVDYKAGLIPQACLYLFFIGTALYGIWTAYLNSATKAEKT